MRNVRTMIERLEREHIARYNAIIGRVFSQLTDNELREFAGDVMARLSDDELEAIAAGGGDPPDDYTEEPLPVWWWSRVKDIVTPREYVILGGVA